MRTLVVGLGNPILTDDAVGWRVAERLRDCLPPSADLDVQVACVGGLSLAEMLVGYERALIIDSIITKQCPPGTLYHLSLEALPGTLNSSSAHDTNLITALETLRRYGATIPSNQFIEFIAIEARDVWTFGEHCTPEIEASLPTATEMVLALLQIFPR